MAEETETTETTEAQTTEATAPPADLDAYLATLDEGTRTLVDGLRTKWHDDQVGGLKSALNKERDAAAAATKQLRELAKTADADTAAKLEKLATEKDAELDSARKESTFYREAATAGVPADKLARAWLLCRNADYFTKRGDPDIAAMKAEIPELFAAPVAQTTQVRAGAGTRQDAAVVAPDPLRAAVERVRGITRL